MEKNTETSQYKQAVFFVILSAAGFASMSLFIRWSGDIPTFEKSFFRNFIAAIIAILSVFRGQKLTLGKPENIKPLAVRVLCGTIALFCNFYAVDHMLIANASMLNKFAPFAALISSYFVLKEKITTKQAICIITAFIGVIFILKPSADVFSTIPSIIGLAGGIGAGIAYSHVRVCRLNGVSAPLIILAFSSFSCIVSLILMIPVFVIPSSTQLLFLILTGVSAAFGQFAITAAYARVGASRISIYEYSQVIFAAIFGILFFREIPDILCILGYIIIIGASLIMYRSK